MFPRVTKATNTQTCSKKSSGCIAQLFTQYIRTVERPRRIGCDALPAWTHAMYLLWKIRCRKTAYMTSLDTRYVFITKDKVQEDCLFCNNNTIYIHTQISLENRARDTANLDIRYSFITRHRVQEDCLYGPSKTVYCFYCNLKRP